MANTSVSHLVWFLTFSSHTFKTLGRADVKNAGTAESSFLDTLIDLCDNLAWGRPANEDALYALTREGSGPSKYVRLAEAFGMMLMKIEGREFHRSQLIAELEARNAELEEAHRLLAERHTHLMLSLQETYQTKKIIGQCEAMRRIMDLAMSIARRPINTLILGPTGSGKEVIAKAIHFNSPRREGPFIAVNCTAIPDSLFESEMFGIEKGVATGVGLRKGLIEEANGGTLFLDELADMTLPNQAKLLRVLEEREVLRVGSSKPIKLDIKVIAATNAALEEAVRKGTFRQDLYYRINVAEIRLPPLKERGDDILLLAQLFLKRHCGYMGRPPLSLSQAACSLLMAYDWPGNVRELNNEMERAASLTFGPRVEASDLSARILKRAKETAAEKNVSMPEAYDGGGPAVHRYHSLAEMEKAFILNTLERNNGNKSRTAEELGITREGLRKKLLRMGCAESSSQEEA